MSKLLEILRGTARVTGLTGAFLATAAFTHLYTKIDVENNMAGQDNKIIYHHNNLVDVVNSMGRGVVQNRKDISRNRKGLQQIIEWTTKEGATNRIMLYGLSEQLKRVSRDIEAERKRVDAIEGRERSRFDGKYDFNNSLVDYNEKGLEGIAESLYFVRTKTTFEKKEGEKTETKTLAQKGGATAILDGRYLITCRHVVSRDELSVVVGPFKMTVPGYEKKSEKSCLLLGEEEVELETVLKDRENDIAIFKVPEGYELNSLPCAMGSSDELERGNFLYVVGVPGNFGVNVREGIYSTGKVPEKLKKSGFASDNAFMVSCGLNPGDSGTMIIGVRDGQYELVGLPQGKFHGPEKMGWAIGMSPVKKIVRNYLEQNDLVKKHRDLYDGLK